jgi:hypothetical protein
VITATQGEEWLALWVCGNVNSRVSQSRDIEHFDTTEMHKMFGCRVTILYRYEKKVIHEVVTRRKDDAKLVDVF